MVPGLPLLLLFPGSNVRPLASTADHSTSLQTPTSSSALLCRSTPVLSPRTCQVHSPSCLMHLTPSTGVAIPPKSLVLQYSTLFPSIYLVGARCTRYCSIPTHLYLRCTHEHPRSSISKPPTPLVLSQNMHFCHRSHLAHAQRRRSVFSYPPAPLDVRPACTLYPPPASYSSNMPVRTLQPAIPPFGAIPGADTLFLSPYTPNPRCYTTAWLPMPSFSCCTHQLPSSLHRHHCFSYPSMPITSPSDQECPSYLYPHPTPSHVDSGIFARCPFLI
ncbi:unnamed protein product [Somion occarium]|uniref:Uncharacterized protein n=1 Tax=Somion occarium TaxID=3059160 RepID=A0ABP1DMC4_9APHY